MKWIKQHAILSIIGGIIIFIGLATAINMATQPESTTPAQPSPPSVAAPAAVETPPAPVQEQPLEPTTPVEATPEDNGATAQCADGSYSYSAHRQGTCSWHGGVAIWY